MLIQTKSKLTPKEMMEEFASGILMGSIMFGLPLLVVLWRSGALKDMF